MKNISNRLLLFILAVTLFGACKKEENKIFFEGSSPVTLSANSNALNLNFLNAQKEVLKLSWNNPGYKFTTGVSSQDVNYKIEMDTTGSNFTNPNRKIFSISKEPSMALTDSAINDALLNQLGLLKGIPHNVEFRVIASLINDAVPVVSNVLKFSGVVPYAIPPKVAPPTNGTLWMTGDAAKSGWANPLGAPYDVNQKFTQVNPTLYELTVALPGGGGYKLIQDPGNWGTQYHMLAGGTWEGGDFEKKDADPQFPGPPTAGNYKITFDFQKGKFTVVKL